MRDSEPLAGVNPGQAIRFPVEEKGRFEGLSEENWKTEFYVMPEHFGCTNELDAAVEEHQH